MDILSALKKSVLSVKEWVDENKVQKVSGKGLSTNDYTTVEKNKVAAMPNDLVILDGKLFLAQDGTPIDDSAVTLPSGGGGGGGVAVSADGNSIVLVDDVFKLVGFDAAETGAQPRKNAEGKLEWVVPSTETVEGLQATVAGLRSDVNAVQEILTPTGEGQSPLADRVSSLETKMDGTGEGTVDAKIDAKINDFANKISEDGTVNTFKELVDYVAARGSETADMAADITALQGLVGDTAVATQISTAVTAAKTELKGGTSDTDASATIAGAKKYADKLNTAMDTRVDALEASIGEGGSVSAQITAEINKLDKADTAVDGKYVSAVSETDGIITVTRADLPDYSETYAAKKHTHAVADVTGLQTELDKVTTLIGNDASKSVRTIANEELAAQLIPENAKESLNTLQEIAQWIQDHPDDVTAIHAAITALQKNVGDTPVAAQIKAVTDPIAAKSHEHANKALLDTYTQTETNLADAVVKKHEHANKTELDKIADGDKAKWDAAVQTITPGTGLTATKTGTDVAIGFDDTVVWVFDCGTSAE